MNTRSDGKVRQWNSIPLAEEDEPVKPSQRDMPAYCKGCVHQQLTFWLEDQDIDLEGRGWFDRYLKAIDVLGIDVLGPRIVEAVKVVGKDGLLVLDEVARMSKGAA